MSDSPAPRRSGRERKTTQLFSSQENNKRRAGESETETDSPSHEDADGDAEIEDPEDGDEAAAPADEEEEEDYAGPAKSAPGARKGKRKATGKPREPRPVKKPRTTKAKPAGTTTRRGRKAKEGEDAFDAAQVEKDTKISSDNPLFNAILNPAAALQSTAEDFLESLNQSPGHAQAELVNLILRCCGCNDSVNEDEAVDYDGVVDALDNFTEALKQDNSPTYPLTSKLPIFKKFRKSLSEFIERLIISAADLGSLYASDLMLTLQTWVVPMSSSQIRSFRHTATVLAMEAETALCDVAAKVEKEAEVIARQREGEKKRKAATAAGAKGKGAREKELEGKAQEVRSRRNKLTEFLKEFVDGVFVHRYRDLDPTIRAECVHALGVWFKKHPSTFLDTSYLRYVGWVLSDANNHVRLEAVKSLQHVYAATTYLTSLNHFTERFKPRLIEMATSDTELSVRTAVVQVLSAIEDASLLEEEEREKLCLLVFDPEVRVRKAVSEFVASAWKETVDERCVGVQASPVDTNRIGIKALAALLVRWSQALDADSEDAESQEEDAADDVSEAAKARRKELSVLLSNSPKNRITLAVDALWGVLDAMSDWDGLLDVVLLDHTAAEENVGSSSPSKRRRANEKAAADAVNDAWRLDEDEETILLQVLVAAISKAKAESVGGKKGEEENLSSDITRALIKALPRLFAKYQADHNRVAEVLLLPTFMNLDLYLDMRMVPAYSTLWDEVNKLFLSQSSTAVLVNAVKVVSALMDATSLTNTNSAKILELEDELSTSLRDIIAGRDDIEVAVFSEDEVLALTSICTRLAILSGCRDLSGWIEENEGGKQSSAWDILMALSERGRMGNKEEEVMIEQALTVLSLYIFWKAKGLMGDLESSPDDTRYRDTLREQRDSLLQKLVDFSIGSQSNTVDGVKRAAFKQLLNIHILFATGQTRAADGAVLPLATIPVTLDDEVQYRCAGFIQAEVEQYAETTGPGRKPVDEERSDSESEDDDEEDRNVIQVNTKSRAQLEKEYVFVDVITTYLRAIRAGVIDLRHCAVLLAHYGRFGSNVDSCSKVVLDSLRQECRKGGDTETVVGVITETIQDAFDLVIGGYVSDETNAVHLAKSLSTALVIRGAQLAIVHSMDIDSIVQIHTDLLDWIGKRLAGYQANNSRRLMKKALTFFRVLTPVVVGIKPEDGLRIKAHMDQTLAEAKVDSSSTAKMWDAHKAYEKRLGVSTARSRAGKGRGRPRKGGKSAAAVATDDEGNTTEEEVPVVIQKTPTRSRPRPRRAASKRTPADADIEPSQAEQSEPEASSPRREVTTTPRVRTTYGKSPAKRRAASGADSSPANEETPRASRKRGRSVIEEEDEAGEDTVPTVPPSEEPPSSPGEMEIRRKRIRR